MRSATLWHATVALLILSPLGAGAATEQRGSTGSQSEVGIPVPGTASDQETTLKRRDPALKIPTMPKSHWEVRRPSSRATA